MKRTIKKILSSMLVIVVLLLCSNIQRIYGVGILHQAWVQENATDSYVLFRTYTTPHPSTLSAYSSYNKSEKVSGTATSDASFYNTETDKTDTSYWVYKDRNESFFDDMPGEGQFQTYELVFFGGSSTYTIGNYVGYEFDIRYTQMVPTSAAIGNQLNTAMYNSAVAKSDSIGIDDYPDEEKIAYNTSGYLSGDSPLNNTDPWFRMTLVAATSKPQNRKPIYITDRKLEDSVVAEIRNNAINKNLFFTYSSYQRCLRVSNILTSLTYNRGYTYSETSYDRLDTPYSFMDQGAGWSEESLGLETAALGSAMNLYDNIIVFPDEGTRTIEIRHINIENNEVISTEAVTNAGKVEDYANVEVGDDGKPVNQDEKEKLNSLLIEDSTSQVDFAEEYIGYNVANALTKDDAIEAIKAKVEAGNIDSIAESYTVPAFNKTQDEVIIVEMYYRTKPRKFKEVHIYYNEIGVEVSREEKEHNRDDNDNYITISNPPATKTLFRKDNTGAYKFIGAVAKNTDIAPNNLAEYNKDNEYLVLKYENDISPTKYAYFGYQTLVAIEERHILFTTGESGYTNLSEPTLHNLATGQTKELIAKLNSSKYEYKGVISKQTDGIRSLSEFNNPEITTFTATSADKYVYFAYLQNSAEIYVRHILFDVNGDYKKTLNQYKVGNSTDNTTVDRGNLYPEYQYKGYIKTNTDDIPTLGAYVYKDSCVVDVREVKKGEVYVNFLYKEKSDNIVTLAQPDISATGLIDFDTTENKTENCVSEVYTQAGKWRAILSVPIDTNLKFGIIKQPKYILGALNIVKEEKENDGEKNIFTGKDESDITKSFAVITNVTAHGISTDGATTQQMAVTNVYKFIFPWKYSEYVVNNKKIFKLSESKIYQPGYTSVHHNNKVVGEPMLSDKEVYEAFYSIANIDIEFNQGESAKLATTDNFEYELYIDPTKSTPCVDSDYGDVTSCDGMVISSHEYREETPDSSWLNSSGILNIIGINVSADVKHTIIENVHVYASHDKETGEMGLFGMFKYQNSGAPNDIVDIKIINNDNVAQQTQTLLDTIKEFFVDIINGLLELIGVTNEGKIKWKPDESKRILLGLAQNVQYYLNGNSESSIDGEKEANRDVIFKLGLTSTTNQSTLSIGNEIIAQNRPSKTHNLVIDSSNFTPEIDRQTGLFQGLQSLISGLSMSYEEKLYQFEGFIDFSETGVMTITEKGKEYYTKGFDIVEDLNEEATIRTDGKNFEDKINSSYIDRINKYSGKNGLRIFAGDILYKASTEIQFNDNLYYSEKTTPDTMYVFKSTRKSYREDINKDETVTYTEGGVEKTEKSVEIVNVYTPIKVLVSDISQNHMDEPESELEGPISASGLTDKVVLESGFKFDVGVQQYNGTRYSSIGVTKIKEYLKGFYVKFDFSTKELKVNDNDKSEYSSLKIKVNGGSYSGGSIPANAWIYIPASAIESGENKLTISAKSINPITGKASYTVRAVANNIWNLESRSKTSSLASFYETYQNICNDKYPYESTIDPDTNKPIKTDDSPVYYDEETKEINVKSVERLYDFRVTDVKDIDWKDVFRNGTEHNGLVYYSGTTRWRKGYEDPLARTAAEIGTDPSRLLPIGPFKHASGTYVNAPKLGYRISFDVKLTGEYAPNKVVIIEPEFYYVSKSGGDIKKVDLYYKNSSGTYVKIGDKNNDNYDLTFTPDDGYRLLEAGEKHLSKKSVSLYTNDTYGVLTDDKTPLTRLVLKASTMSTSDDSNMVFYGEYKLPNSTIAVEEGKKITDKNNYLSDGYIGVKFNITYYHNVNVESKISYGVGMKKKIISGVIEAILGTSQWQYEGYLGIKYGNTLKNAQLKLEKGTWNIGKSDSDTYQQILGTVVLFDLDNRAATDFN